MPTRKNSFLEARFSEIRQYRMRSYVIRFLTAFVFVLTLFTVSSEVAFTDLAFYSDSRLILILLFTALLGGVLLFVPFERVISLALIVIAEVYFLFIASTAADYFLSFALCLVLAAAVVYADPPRGSLQPGRWTLLGGTFLLFLASSLFIGIITCLYYKNHWTPNFDFGLFSQMFHYMKETGECLVTSERDGLLSHFAVHFSPIYYLLLPIYALIPSPGTLLVMQGVIVASGVFPLVLLCKHHGLSHRTALLFAAIYVLYPATTGGCLYYLHENCFLAPLILWLLYFSDCGRILPALGFALLTLAVKEDAAVYVAVIALYLLVSAKKPKLSLPMLGLSVMWFIVVTSLMGKYGEGIMSDSRYGDYIYDDGGIFTVIKAVVQNPAYAIRQILREEKLLFILQMLAPLCFLPFVIKRPSKLILLIPLLLVNLMTSYVYQYDIGFQYVFGSGAILFYLAVTNYAELGEGRWRVLLIAVLGAAIIFAGGVGQKLGYIKTYRETAEERIAMDAALDLVPEDASVAATTFLVANLSSRDVIYELETTKHRDEVEYIVIDLRYTQSFPISPYFGSGYSTVFYQEGLVGIFKNEAVVGQ